MINLKNIFNVRDCFKNRTVGFYLSLVSALAALIIALVYVIVANSDRTFNLAGMIIIVIGALSEVLVLFTDLKFAPMVPTLLLSVGGAISFITCLPTMLDVLNGIQFFGGNLFIAEFVSFGMLAVILIGCVASFMGMRKVTSEAAVE